MRCLKGPTALYTNADTAVQPGSDLEGVLLALDLSKVTFNRIRLNFFWAMAYNVVMLPMAAGALYPCVHMQIPPWVAGEQHATLL